VLLRGVRPLYAPDLPESAVLLPPPAVARPPRLQYPLIEVALHRRGHCFSLNPAEAVVPTHQTPAAVLGDPSHWHRSWWPLSSHAPGPLVAAHRVAELLHPTGWPEQCVALVRTPVHWARVLAEGFHPTEAGSPGQSRPAAGPTGRPGRAATAGRRGWSPSRDRRHRRSPRAAARGLCRPEQERWGSRRCWRRLRWQRRRRPPPAARGGAARPLWAVDRHCGPMQAAPCAGTAGLWLLLHLPVMQQCHGIVTLSCRIIDLRDCPPRLEPLHAFAPRESMCMCIVQCMHIFAEGLRSQPRAAESAAHAHCIRSPHLRLRRRRGVQGELRRGGGLAGQRQPLPGQQRRDRQQQHIQGRGEQLLGVLAGILLARLALRTCRMDFALTWNGCFSMTGQG